VDVLHGPVVVQHARWEGAGGCVSRDDDDDVHPLIVTIIQGLTMISRSSSDLKWPTEPHVCLFFEIYDSSPPPSLKTHHSPMKVRSRPMRSRATKWVSVMTDDSSGRWNRSLAKVMLWL
jgi:hypothetical protein